MSQLRIDALWKTYPGGVTAVRGVSLAVDEGELVVLLGPSGCGKSTVLRMIAGLEDISAGTIELDGRVLNDLPERDRDIAMVFQSYALYPHMTVAGNIGYPLKHRKVRTRERRKRVEDVASVLELQDVLDRKPGELSGGQRQRVAMARAMVREPRLFLLDEPLSNLDAALRIQMRTEIHALQRRLGVGMVYVTHDQTEAMTLGDRVVVMRHGQLQQIGAPEDVYRRPMNVFVAGFMGSPGMTLFEAPVVEGPAVVCGEQLVHIDERELRAQPAVANYRGRRVIVGVRAEDLALMNGDRGGRGLMARMRFQEQLGSSLIAYFSVDGLTRGGSINEDLERRLADDGPVPSDKLINAPQFLPGRFASSATLDRDASTALVVQPGGLRFFDSETGLAV
jgi:multiple sugar transport system ATP-binding protein